MLFYIIGFLFCLVILLQLTGIGILLFMNKSGTYDIGGKLNTFSDIFPVIILFLFIILGWYELISTLLDHIKFTFQL